MTENQNSDQADWKHMVEFSMELIKQSTKHIGTGIIGDRIIILHLDHANELLMKAFLLRKGYIVSYLDESAIRNGVKSEKFLDESKTMKYADCLTLVLKELNLQPAEKKMLKERILQFHKLRNVIQHRATNIPLDKGEEIIRFSPCLEKLFNSMFGDLGFKLDYASYLGLCLDCRSARIKEKQEIISRTPEGEPTRILIKWQCEGCGNIVNEEIIDV